MKNILKPLIFISIIFTGTFLIAQEQKTQQGDSALTSLYSQSKAYVKIFESKTPLDLERKINQYAIDNNSIILKVSMTAVNDGHSTTFLAAVIYGRE